MKRLGLVVSLLVLLGAPTLFGGPGQSDVLLTTNGTLYVVEVADGGELPEGSGASTAIRLRTILGDVETTEFIPASLVDGFSSSPALAFDEQSETLFIFWVRRPQITMSELVFSSYHDGQFSEATAVDRGLLRMRSNLRIAVTRYAKRITSESVVSAVAVHAVWWDSTGYGETARYALLSISNGVASVVDVQDLVAYLGADGEVDPVLPPEGFDPEILRYPAIESAGTQDRVEIVFADPVTNHFHRIDLFPVIADGVLKPPVGIWRGELPVPSLEMAYANSVSTFMGSPTRTDLILYVSGENRIDYVHYNDGEWSGTHTIRVDDRVTEATALEALKRLLATH